MLDRGANTAWGRPLHARERSECGMRIRVTLSNYRPFSAPTRASFEVIDGIVAFVGKNNSGKSTIIRSLYELRSTFLPIAQGAGNLATALQGSNHNLAPPREVRDVRALLSHNAEGPLTLDIRVEDIDGTPRPVPSGSPTEFADTVRIIIHRESPGVFRVQPLINGDVRTPSATHGDGLVVFGDRVFDYAPIIEAARRLANALYIGPFRNIINVGGVDSYYDLPIGGAFITAWASAQSGHNIEANRAVDRVIKEIETLFGISRLEIMASDDRQSLKARINGTPFDVSELGSGLAQFIAVLYNASLKRPSYILIDEPEANLHPSLQLDFILALANYAKHGVLFATHSLGLARAAAEVTYSVHKPLIDGPAYIKDFKELRSIAEFVGELSYSGNYNLGFRNILLVEGRTDIKLFQQLLSKFGAEHTVTIVHLGGSSGINGKASEALAELKHFDAPIYAIVDSESPEAGKIPKDRREFQNACAALSIECLLTERRQIEAYFTDAAVKDVLGPSFSAPGAFDEVKAWPKELNWKIARRMAKEDIEATDVGAFIKHIVSAVMH